MRWTLLYCLLCFSLLIHAQPKTLSVDHLSVENGLPENYPTDIVQDAKGYMWIGTQLGLVRYDGYKAKVYKEEMDKVKSGFFGVQSLLIDSYKTLWVGTQQQGLLKYNPVADTFTTYPYSKNEKDTLISVLKILEDRKGNLWLLSEDIKARSLVLNMFNKASIQFTCFGSDNKNGIPANKVFKAISDKAGNIWAGTNNGIYKFDPSKNIFTGFFTSTELKNRKSISEIYEPPSESGILYMDLSDSSGKNYGMIRFDTRNNTSATFNHSFADANSILSDTVLTIKEDNAHRLWIGTSAGLSLFNRSAGNFTNYTIKDHNVEKYANSISSIQDDVTGFLWLASGKGLLSFNPVTGNFIRYLSDNNREDAVPTNYFLRIFRDTMGGIWLTTRSYGIQKVNNARSRFTVIRNIPDHAESYNGGRVYIIVEDIDHTYWMSTSKGLCHYDPVNNSFKTIKLFSEPGYVGLSIINPKNRLIWGTRVNKGIYSYNLENGKIKTYNFITNDTTSLSDSVVACMYEDHAGTLWVGTGEGGICRFNKEKEYFTRYPFITNSNHSYSGKALDDETVLCMFEDSQGRFWVGTNEGGVNLMDRENGTFTSYQDLQKGLGCIVGITEDNKGRLWLASYVAGVSIFDPATGNTRRFTETNGLLCNSSQGICKDKQGNLWISSERGISFINPETLVIKNFTKAQGLPDNVFVTEVFCNSNGILMAGYKAGIILFSPSIAKPDNVIPITNIESLSFTIFSREGERDSTLIISGQKKVDLNYDENRVSFNYIGLQYENSMFNKYSYKLEGYDKDWIEGGALRTATYTNLSPGTYTFFVKSANSDGVWNDTPESIQVIIHPPWWRTWWAYLLYVLIFGLLVWSYIGYRSRALRRKNVLLEDKISHRTSQLQKSIEDLKNTQSQLIQSEKMASLGELTAGIAHEIQNPLNFVNNFSEVSSELADELQEAVAKNDTEEAVAISNDIKQNLRKINFHGKRADAIVKGMLQHSRTSTGKKEPTDINALTDEYLRLSYHGLRAKDKSFNVTMETSYDETLEKVNIISQEVGRVILNLFTNAFYSVAEKKKMLTASGLSEGKGYAPTVWVITKKTDEKAEIRIRDNGNGIPQKVLDKIYQPFFTTKPTGDGTGLGLSLSYDIIKAHGGELKVDTKEGEFAEFIIIVPIE